ncbi:ATPase FtsK/SpoIIIE [Bacillus phage Beyonphe]|nr:ATPase FtsK/SpoIIIE [Bacillus phage Beyonphe]
MKSKGYKNISNYFSQVEDVSGAFKTILEQETDGVFGVELEMYKGGRNITVVTPPHIRFSETNVLPYRLTLVARHTDDLHAYEGYLSKPSFLPLYEGMSGLFLRELLEIQVGEDEALEIQWLFKRYIDSWLLTSIDRYKSYLSGNEYPAGSKIGRTFQDKILHAINKLSSFDMARTYSEKVEQKIVGKVYKFKLGITIRSKEPKRLLEQIESILRKYDSHNTVSLYKRKLKGLKDECEERLVMNGENVVSDSEIVSLFGGTVVAPQEVDSVQSATTEPNKVRTPRKDIGGLVSLLPTYPREEVKVDENIVSYLAEAMKRVGLIPTARLANSTVTAGARLTVIQCDIPKKKNLSHLISKASDIQAALGVPSLSIEQGEEPDTAKFTLPNEEAAIISLRELIESPSFQEYASEHALPFIVGVDEVDTPIYLDLTKLVHLMIAGTTGSGKSVFMNTLIICLMATNSPEMLRFVMIDPKIVELAQYEDMAHVDDIVTDMEKAGTSLNKLVEEMEKRYETFKDAGVKNIKVYNEVADCKLPYIVCVIDEYADLHDTNPHVEEYVTRLGQKARAAGIHLVIATQRPDSKVISGRIKANVQNAISFNLNSNVDYKTVFGKGIGNTTLLGRGDGVMRIVAHPKEFQRFQSAMVSPNEVEESKVYQGIRDYFNEVNPETLNMDDLYKEVAEEPLIKLKKIIASTRETKVGKLRELMGIKAEALTELMGQLVEEGWLVKHASKTKGYELIIPEEMLNEYKGDW